MLSSLIADSEQFNNNNNNDVNKENYTKEKAILESDYIQANIEAFQSIRKNDYYKAKDLYKNCLSNAKDLNDNYKIVDSSINYSIILFYLGKFEESKESLERTLKIYFDTLNNNKNNSLLLIKILSNLVLINLSLNDTNSSLDYLDTLINFIDSEKDLNNQYNFIKNALFIFFRVESLIDFFELNSTIYLENKDDEQQQIIINNERGNSEITHKKTISKIIFFLHKYFKDGDLSSWINCLNEEKENFKTLGDTNGFVFAVFNQYISILSLNKEDFEAKAKINSIKKVLNAEDMDLNHVINEVKDKFEVSSIIYNKLFNLEKEILIKVKNQEKISNFNKRNDNKDTKIFFKIFLKYALNYLNDDNTNNNNITNEEEKFKNQMKSHILLTLKLIENNELDLTSIKILNIDPEISNSLKMLFENLMYIRHKFYLLKFFLRYKYNTLGYISVQEHKEINSKRFEIFMMKHLNKINQGKSFFELFKVTFLLKLTLVLLERKSTFISLIQTTEKYTFTSQKTKKNSNALNSTK